jgi:hypothetical protein
MVNDNTWTLAGISSYCWLGYDGISPISFQLFVTVNNTRRLTNMYLFSTGVVSSYYKNNFAVKDFGNGLSATKYAFFFPDSNHEVMDHYPVTNVCCGTGNFNAYKKLYSVFPDVFDFDSVMPGMQIYHPGDFGENTPYQVAVKYHVKNIGISNLDRTAEFSSSGKLISTVFHSFGDIAIMDHEITHTWGAFIGNDLGQIESTTGSHWSPYTDIGGQLAYSYQSTSGEYVGYFVDNGDGPWQLIKDADERLYSPLELYIMGLIPLEQVPPIHILSGIDISNLVYVTAT